MESKPASKEPIAFYSFSGLANIISNAATMTREELGSELEKPENKEKFTKTLIELFPPREKNFAEEWPQGLATFKSVKLPIT